MKVTKYAVIHSWAFNHRFNSEEVSLYDDLKDAEESARFLRIVHRADGIREDFFVIEKEVEEEKKPTMYEIIEYNLPKMRPGERLHHVKFGWLLIQSITENDYLIDGISNLIFTCLDDQGISRAIIGNPKVFDDFSY